MLQACGTRKKKSYFRIPRIQSCFESEDDSSPHSAMFIVQVTVWVSFCCSGSLAVPSKQQSLLVTAPVAKISLWCYTPQRRNAARAICDPVFWPELLDISRLPHYIAQQGNINIHHYTISGEIATKNHCRMGKPYKWRNILLLDCLSPVWTAMTELSQWPVKQL